MQEIQPELVERYQILLAKEPKSQVFAPLAEAYRKMGLTDEAFRIAVRGVQYNPQFAGGRVALAKIFLDRDMLPSAISELEKAVESSFENLMAHGLLAECYLKAKRPKDALRAFKMVLFLAPNHEKARRAVQKLESLTADEYEDDLFEMKPLPRLDRVGEEPEPEIAPRENVKSARPGEPNLERVLSLVDAYIVRNDVDKATEALRDVGRWFGDHPEVIKRTRLINRRNEPAPSGEVPSRQAEDKRHRIDFLRGLLGRIERNSRLLHS